MNSLTLVALALVLGQTPQTRAAAIKAAKDAVVQDIDKALPRTTFEAWLRGVIGAQATATWETNDCGEQTGNPAADRGRDFPLCAEVHVGLSRSRQLSLSLLVGSMSRGLIVGPPAFHHGNISGPRGSETIAIQKLSDVTKLIEP